MGRKYVVEHLMVGSWEKGTIVEEADLRDNKDFLLSAGAISEYTVPEPAPEPAAWAAGSIDGAAAPLPVAEAPAVAAPGETAVSPTPPAATSPASTPPAAVAPGSPVDRSTDPVVASRPALPTRVREDAG